MASNDIAEGPGNQKQSCLRELFKEQSCRYIVPWSLTHQLGTRSSGQATLSVVKWLPRILASFLEIHVQKWNGTKISG